MLSRAWFIENSLVSMSYLAADDYNILLSLASLF